MAQNIPMGIQEREENRVEYSTDRASRLAYEREWKEKFSRRLQTLAKTRGLTLSHLAEAMECGEERAQTLLSGGDFPTVPELLRLCFLCYDADEVLFGARDAGLFYLLRGKFQ